jgi:hypothetical protein
VSWDTWQHRSPPQPRGRVQCCRTRSSLCPHIQMFVFILCLYAGVPDLPGTDTIIIRDQLLIPIVWSKFRSD